jgi:DUF1009 family protein
MLAIFAGKGALPGLLRAVRPDALICELDGQPSDLSGAGVLTWRIETLGTHLAKLRAHGVTEVCLAGGIRRPNLDPAAVDALTRPILARLMGALVAGDDAALRAVMGVLEDAGFAVRAAHDIRPDLLPPPGIPTRAQPAPGMAGDADRGLAVIAAMGKADVGQACVVRAGQVMAVEATPGTDWMLASLSPAPSAPRVGDPLTWAADAAADVIDSWADWLTGPGVARPTAQARPTQAIAAGGVLVKAPKPAQDRRADLPAIGPGTAEGAARAGLAGIVVQAGGVMVLDLPATVAACDRAGLFLWVRA